MNWTKGEKIISKIPANHTVMLKGVHGIGKTEFVHSIAKKYWNLPLVTLQGSQLSDIGDLIGLQRINEKTGHTEWVPPYWLRSLTEPFVLFLDEINRTDRQIRKSMMQLGLEHRILNFELPEGSRVICAVNPSEDGYDTDEFSDDAERDRFKEFTFAPTVEEWLDYAIKSGVNEFITGYISQNPNDLDPYKNKENAKVIGGTSNKLSSRRAFTQLSELFNTLSDSDFEGRENLDDVEEMAAGYVGPIIAAKLRRYIAENANGLTPKSIIECEDFSKVKGKIEKLGKTSKIEVVNLGHSIATYFKENIKKFDNKDWAKKASMNFYNFLKTIKPEPRAEIFTTCVETEMNKAGADKKKSWVSLTKNTVPELGKMYIDIVDYDV